VTSQEDLTPRFVDRMIREGFEDSTAALEEGVRRGWVEIVSLGDALASPDPGKRAAAERAQADGESTFVMRITAKFEEDTQSKGE
jgi:hypothetical protein